MNRLLRWVAPAAAQIVLGGAFASASIRAQLPLVPSAYRLNDGGNDERLETRHLPPPMLRADSSKHRSRRAAVAGGVVGAVLGGLGAAGYILNATAYDCITSGPPCPRKNYTFLNTITIAAGAAAGGFVGGKVGRWLGK
jgi:hypothetical protein